MNSTDLEDYSLIRPPCSLDLDHHSLETIQAYKTWFLDSILMRAFEVERQVQKMGSWTADFSPSSLEKLNEWFHLHIARRPITDAERNRLRASMPTWVPLEDHTLTNTTMSIVIDVAMYVGEMVVRHVAGVHWTQRTDNRRHDDFGHMLLEGSRRYAINPAHVIEVVAGKSCNGDRKTHLSSIFERWSSILSPHTA